VRRFVQEAKQWVIANAWTSSSQRRNFRPGRVGVWVNAAPDKPLNRHGPRLQETRSRLLGIRLRKWVSVSRLSINVERKSKPFLMASCPAQSSDHGVTSLVLIWGCVTHGDLDVALRQKL